ncbi:MAG: EAL domain-containing protein [Comamonas sp.]|nr:EAL domain-containing protein [Comamonas sp.]
MTTHKTHIAWGYPSSAMVLGGITLLLGLVLTYVLVQQQRVADAALAEVRFVEEVRSSTDALYQRIVTQTEVVAGLRDLFIINPYLDFAQFQQVADAHDVRHHYPEIRYLSFVRHVQAPQLSAYVQRIRAQATYRGHSLPSLPTPEVALTADAGSEAGEGGEERTYFLLEYLWPWEESRVVWGMDLSAQPALLSALQSCRARAGPAVSSPVDGAQARADAPAFMLCLPVFAPPSSPWELEAPFLGIVAAVVDVHGVLASVQQQGFLRGIAVQLEDVGETAAAFHPSQWLGASDNFALASARQYAQPQVRLLQIHDRYWRLRFMPTQPLLSEAERLLPWSIAGGGTTLSVLLAVGLWWLLRRQVQQAESLNQAQQRSILEHLPVGVNLMLPDGRFSYRNPAFLQITGYDLQTVPDITTWWLKAYPDPAYRQHVRTRWNTLAEQARQSNGLIAPQECIVTHADGQPRTLQISGALLGSGELVVLQDLTSYKVAEAKINYLEFYDALTQLPNRRLMLKNLQQALIASSRQGDYGAVLMLDIDHFKTVNETLGHESGDALLRQVAERLHSCTQERYVVARHGDDEFVILLEDLAPQVGQAVTLAEAFGRRVLEAFQAPFVLGQRPQHCTVSIGIALFQGEGDSADELLKRADLAMYQAKVAGRDTLHFYSPSMQASVQARVQLEAAMRQGLEQQHFELHFQPQIHHTRVIACEALLRWRRPEHGMVSPAEFVPLAEATGLIVPLGHWVLHAACAQLVAWADQPHLAHLRIAINVSARQFHQSDFVQRVLHAIAHTGADARKLELELTEGLLLQDVEDTIEKMLELKRHGISFALDDFGTGYSSLAYLKRLPLDQLKIDQGFVRDILTDANDAAIARTVVALGTSLGLHVIAEGVETVAQRDCLQGYGCLMWQGYLFSRPLPATQFADWVQQFEAQAPSQSKPMSD